MYDSGDYLTCYDTNRTSTNNDMLKNISNAVPLLPLLCMMCEVRLVIKMKFSAFHWDPVLHLRWSFQHSDLTKIPFDDAHICVASGISSEEFTTTKIGNNENAA